MIDFEVFFGSCQHLLSQLGAEGHVPGVVLLWVVHRDRGHLCQVSVVLSVLDCLRTWLVVEERTKDEEGLADEARHLWGQAIIFGNRIYLFSKYIQHFAFCHEDWVI